MENIFSLASSKGFKTCPSMRLTTNNSPSHGLSPSSSLGDLEWLGDLDLWELWSIMTTPSFTITLRLEGQLEAICPKPKHLKHFLLEVLVGDLGVVVEGLKSLGL